MNAQCVNAPRPVRYIGFRDLVVKRGKNLRTTSSYLARVVQLLLLFIIRFVVYIVE